MYAAESHRAPFISSHFEHLLPSQTPQNLKNRRNFLNRTSHDDLKGLYFKSSLLASKKEIGNPGFKKSLRGAKSPTSETKRYFRRFSKDSDGPAGLGGSNTKVSNLAKYKMKSDLLDSKINEVEERFNEQYSDFDETLYQGRCSVIF